MPESHKLISSDSMDDLNLTSDEIFDLTQVEEVVEDSKTVETPTSTSHALPWPTTTTKTTIVTAYSTIKTTTYSSTTKTTVTPSSTTTTAWSTATTSFPTLGPSIPVLKTSENSLNLSSNKKNDSYLFGSLFNILSPTTTTTTTSTTTRKPKKVPRLPTKPPRPQASKMGGNKEVYNGRFVDVKRRKLGQRRIDRNEKKKNWWFLWKKSGRPVDDVLQRRDEEDRDGSHFNKIVKDVFLTSLFPFSWILNLYVKMKEDNFVIKWQVQIVISLERSKPRLGNCGNDFSK